MASCDGCGEAETSEKQRDVRRNGLRTVLCTECGERLAHRTPDGLCGFCREGIPAHA